MSEWDQVLMSRPSRGLYTPPFTSRGGRIAHGVNADTHVSTLERIVFFSDAVFSIAITLLAIDIRIPESTSELLPKHLVGLGPSIAVYALSFVVVGLYWSTHHRMFNLIVRFDYTLVWLNMLVLLCVAFLPVPNAIFARYWSTPAAVVLYSASLAAASTANMLLWRYASHRERLIVAGTPPPVVRVLYVRSVTTIAVALLATAVAFESTRASFALLVAYALVAVSRVIVETRRHHA
jgi:uncharacterized membrane protein